MLEEEEPLWVEVGLETDLVDLWVVFVFQKKGQELRNAGIVCEEIFQSVILTEGCPKSVCQRNVGMDRQKVIKTLGGWKMGCLDPQSLSEMEMGPGKL